MSSIRDLARDSNWSLQTQYCLWFPYSEQDLKEKEDLSNCFLNVASKVLPGISRLKEHNYQYFIDLFHPVIPVIKVHTIFTLRQFHQFGIRTTIEDFEKYVLRLKPCKIRQTFFLGGGGILT